MRTTRIALFLVLALAAAACSAAEEEPAAADETAAANETATEAAAADGGDEGVVRFTFAPDPIWDWLVDQGIVTEMEEESGIRILQTSTWDEFGIFAGGHADVISTGTYEIPVLEEETGTDTVTFGKYNRAKEPVLVPADSDYETLEDLAGRKVAVFSAVGSTLIWGAMVQDQYGLDFRAGGGDYEVVVADPASLAELVERGEVDACICIPELSISQLRNDVLRPLYDSKGAAELYADWYFPEHEGVMTNLFVARADWYETHQEEAQFLLEVWERGIREWEENREEIIATYPQHFAVEDPEDIQWVVDYVENTFDWFVDTVYLDEEWVEAEKAIFPLLKETGFMEQDTPEPEFAIVDPAE